MYRLPYNINYKECFVPTCLNTTKTAPRKLFLKVPRYRSVRTQWLKAVNIKVFPDTEGFKNAMLSYMYCCEDHFDLNEDSENWDLFTRTAKSVHFKKGVLPHLKLNHINRPNTESQFKDSLRREKTKYITKCRKLRENGSWNPPDKPSFSFVSTGLNKECLIDLGLAGKKESVKHPVNVLSPPPIDNVPAKQENIMQEEINIKSEDEVLNDSDEEI